MENGPTVYTTKKTTGMINTLKKTRLLHTVVPHGGRFTLFFSVPVFSNYLSMPPADDKNHPWHQISLSLLSFPLSLPLSPPPLFLSCTYHSAWPCVWLRCSFLWGTWAYIYEN